METTTAKLVGQALRRIRTKKKLSLEAVGARCGMTRALVSRIELGAPRTSLDQYRALCGALGISMPRLFAGLPRAHPDGRLVARRAA